LRQGSSESPTVHQGNKGGETVSRGMLPSGQGKGQKFVKENKGRPESRRRSAQQNQNRSYWKKRRQLRGPFCRQFTGQTRRVHPALELGNLNKNQGGSMSRKGTRVGSEQKCPAWVNEKEKNGIKQGQKKREGDKRRGSTTWGAHSAV